MKKEAGNITQNVGMAANEEPGTFTQFSAYQVTSLDGTTIGYRQIGNGPALVIMHGGARASHHYSRLAKALSDFYTVCIPDRRGRGLSGPAGDDYSIQKELEDVSVVLRQTGARLLFGHSGGGFFALETALKLPIDKLAVYEPAVSINGSLPLEWLPKLEQALKRNDPAMAMVLLIKGLQLHWISKLPTWLLYPVFRLAIRGGEGREMAELLPTATWEAREILRADLAYDRYQHISAQTLLLCGARSPAYLRNVLPILAKTIPHARFIELPGLDHNAPDQHVPEEVAAQLKHFFSS